MRASWVKAPVLLVTIPSTQIFALNLLPWATSRRRECFWNPFVHQGKEFRSFTFNVIIDRVKFISSTLLLIFYLSHLFLVPLLVFLFSFALIVHFLVFHFISTIDLLNCITLFYFFLAISVGFKIKLIYHNLPSNIIICEYNTRTSQPSMLPFSPSELCAVVVIHFAALCVINALMYSFALNHYFFHKNFKWEKKVFHFYPHTYHFLVSPVLCVDPSFHLAPFSYCLKNYNIF